MAQIWHGCGCRLAAAAPIGLLAWELPYNAGGALKDKKRNKRASPLSLPQESEYCARPRLDIIQPLSETCEEISSDALTVRGFQENECRDYHLGER